MKWLSRSSPRVLRHWKAGAPKGDGTFDLASWLAYSCATAGTTAQTGLRNVKSGFAANAPRGFARDGSTWGLLVEGPATNLITSQDLSTWILDGAVIASAVLPDGTLQDCSVEDNGPTGVERARLAISMSASTVYTLSAWSYLTTPPAGGEATILCDHDVGSNVPRFNATSTGGWEYLSNTDTTPSGITTTNVSVYATDTVTVAEQGICQWGLIQAEQALSPSSFIDGTRGAGILSLPSPTDLFPGGYYDTEIVFAPTFSSSEHSGFTLQFFDAALGAQDSVTVTSGNILTQTIDGSDVLTAPGLTWSRDQELYVRVAHRPSGTYLKASGFTTGDGEGSAAAQPATSLPATAYLLGGASGPAQGVNVAVRELKFIEAA